MSNRRVDHGGGYVGARGPRGHGHYDYRENKFIMEDGRWARVRRWTRQQLLSRVSEESVWGSIRTGEHEGGGSEFEYFIMKIKYYSFFLLMTSNRNFFCSRQICIFSCFHRNVPLCHQLYPSWWRQARNDINVDKMSCGWRMLSVHSPGSLMPDTRHTEPWATRTGIAVKAAPTCTETWRFPKLWLCWRYQKESSENCQTWNSGQHLRDETPSARASLSRRMSLVWAAMRGIGRGRHRPANLRVQNGEFCLICMNFIFDLQFSVLNHFKSLFMYCMAREKK